MRVRRLVETVNNQKAFNHSGREVLKHIREAVTPIIEREMSGLENYEADVEDLINVGDAAIVAAIASVIARRTDAPRFLLQALERAEAEYGKV